MRSHLKWRLFTVIGAIASVAACMAMGAGTSPNLVINGDFENGNTGFTTGYTIGDVSNPGGYVTCPRKTQPVEAGVLS